MNKPNNILAAIGNTPLVKLNKVVPKNCASVYVKLEYFNPTGSYKDRMALAIIQSAEKRGALKPGMTVVECTGGSTGTSMSFLCAIKGYPFRVVSSDAFAKEKLMSMRLFGADLELVQSEGGMITPDLIPRMIDRAKQITEETKGYWTKQFENIDALEGYKKMGEEISNQLDGSIDLFCAAVGTAGMLMGVSHSLKSKDAKTKVVVLEPASAPLLSKGIKGSHKIEGIATGIIPPLLDKSYYDSVEAIEEAEARLMAKRLAAEEGILAGTSSGLNVAGAIKLARAIGPGHNIVTVACDSGLKYFASGLFN